MLPSSRDCSQLSTSVRVSWGVSEMLTSPATRLSPESPCRESKAGSLAQDERTQTGEAPPSRPNSVSESVLQPHLSTC